MDITNSTPEANNVINLEVPLASLKELKNMQKNLKKK